MATDGCDGSCAVSVSNGATPDRKLTPKEDLFMEVLAGRRRCGERVWTFESRHRDTARKLEAKDLVGWKSGIIEQSILAWLTPQGEAEWLSADYTPPILTHPQTER